MSSAWPALLRLAAERFGLKPPEVCSLSLREWRAFAAPPPAAAPLTRTEFDALLHLHPDDRP